MTLSQSFASKVYAATRLVPRGRVTTYKLLASFIGCGSARAVGQALKRNPYAPEIPCHRVIGSDLRLGGFRGAAKGPSTRVKENLLRKEGVAFRGGRLADAACLFAFDDLDRSGHRTAALDLEQSPAPGMIPF